MTNTALSVSQVLRLAKTALNNVSARVIGEVSELSDKPGYKAVYFTLSDKDSAMPCLMWRNNYALTGVELKAGMLVEVAGVFSLYAAKGRMNFEARSLSIAGEGELRIRVAQLAKKLEAEGLMAAERKRPLPLFPSAVAVVTSPRGKAIHDVLRTLRRRFPLTEVLVCGVPVEGAGAAEAIIEGLEVAQNSSAELILLVRGGGSYEDLMPFNDEHLARAIAQSTLPVVSGIGHEPDNSIADMVADFRASTPTAAAERVVPNAGELAGALRQVQSSFNRAFEAQLDSRRQRLDSVASRPIFSDPEQLFSNWQLELEGASERLQKAIPERLQRDEAALQVTRSMLVSLAARLLVPHQNTVALNAARLHDLSPLKILGRGYSIVFDEQHHVVDTVDRLRLGQTVALRLADGEVGAQIKSKQI